jgi:hypothetical protein
MTDAQFDILMKHISDLEPVLKELAKPTYALTGAVDWPILAAVGGICIMLIIGTWVDLKNTIKDNRIERNDALAKIDLAWKYAVEHIKREIERCQDNCCYGRREGDKK